MISTKEKLILKEVLRGDYVSGVIKILEEGNILSNRGSVYSSSMIRRVFNGFACNLKLNKPFLVCMLSVRLKLRTKKLAG